MFKAGRVVGYIAGTLIIIVVLGGSTIRTLGRLTPGTMGVYALVILAILNTLLSHRRKTRGRKLRLQLQVV